MSPNQLFDLSGQTAIVIGGTGELCGAIAEGLAGAGAHVVLVGRDADKANARIERILLEGGRASFARANVSRKEDLQTLAQQLACAHPSIDILVNGAGVNSNTPFLKIEDEELERIIDINLKGVFYACQAFAPIMLERSKGGSIINIGSMSGLNPLSGGFTYSATKAAVHNLTRNLAREWGPQGLRVNTLVPGFFPADQNRKILTQERVSKIMAHTPMARFGESRELIGATLLLASRKAGSFITGTELIVDGGFNAMSI